MEMKAMSTDRNLLLQLKGELDHHSARDMIREMELAIDAALPRNLVVDMEGITFMDSSGIAFILRAHRRMLNLNGGMLLCHVPRQAKRVLDAAGIGRLVRIQ